MGYRYAVLGAGRQGLASAYDLAVHGDADEIILADINKAAAESSAHKINELTGRTVASSIHLDVSDTDRVKSLTRGLSAMISGVHFPNNPSLTRVAIASGVHMCDFGGNTTVSRQQLAMADKAREAGVTIVPDCGMGPGLNISLAIYAMSLVDTPREVLIWDGGLPLDPVQPWNYLSTFNLEGLTNEYAGCAYFLRNGAVTEVPCFSDYELLEFPPPLGQLEAFVTSGGLSTSPWTLQGKLERLENKTLRYPGHWAQFKAFSDLGLLGEEPLKVGGVSIVPRDLLHTLLEPHITTEQIKDICPMRTTCRGLKDGVPVEATVELIDVYDEETGFTAMQRLTGWHASIMVILATQGAIEPGAHPVELAATGATIVEEFRRRGINTTSPIIREYQVSPA